MIKKILLGIGGLLLLLVLALVLIPVLFKGQIVEKVKSEVNNSLNATIDFGEFDLSLISTFPNLEMNIHDFSVIGVDTFAGDTLAYIGTLDLELDLMSAISGETFKIKSIEVIDPLFQILVLEDGTANYDIAKESSEEEEEATVVESEESGAFSMKMDHYAIKNARVIYDDKPFQTYVEMLGLNHSGDGDFTLDDFILNTLTTIESFTFVYEDVAYMNKVKTELKADLAMDMANSTYTFKENSLTLNNFHVAMDGFIAMPDDMEFDLKFKTDDSEFQYLLSLLPSVYKSDMAGMNIDGAFAFNAYFKGPLTDERFPAYGLNLQVNDGTFQYPDLPQSIKDIQIDFRMDNPTGQDDDAIIDLKRFYSLLGDYVVDFKCKITKPESDPFIDAQMMSQIDLSKLGDFMELEEGESYKGNITANVKMKGALSAIENETYEAFFAEGEVTMLDFNYVTKELPYATSINSAYLYFSPQNVKLSALEGSIGNSDFKAEGQFDNILSYVLKDELLEGSFDFSSSKFDLNELMPEEEEDLNSSEAPVDSLEEYEVIVVPKNIDFVLNTKIDQILYDDMDMRNARGVLEVKAGKVTFKNTSMDMLGGNLGLNGFYSTEKEDQPKLAFFMKIKDFDIPSSYETFNTVKNLAPGAKYMKGSYSTEMSMVTDLMPNLEPDYNTLAGNGKLQSKSVQLVNSPTFTKIADATKYEKLRSANFKDVEMSFHFKDGKVLVDPFDVKMGNAKAKITGENSFDQTINYVMAISIPTSEFGSGASAMASQFSSQLSGITGQEVAIGNELNFDVTAVGPAESPNVKVKPAGSSGSTENLKDQLQNQAEEQIEEVKEQVQEVVDDAKNEAKAKAKQQADKVRADAKKKADKVRAESKKQAAQVKKEGYEKADELIKKAKNPIEKAAAKKAAEKMRKETDKKAKQVIATGESNAKKIEAEGDKAANKIIEEADKA